MYPENAGGPAQSGTECLTHESPGNGRDILQGNNNPSPPGTGLTYPLQIEVGNSPTLTSLSPGDYVTTSDSIITVPVYDDVVQGTPTAAGVQIVGFLQLFINRTWPGGSPQKAGSFTATVLNVAGCGNVNVGPPVSTGTSSPVPVRLIQQ